MGLHIMKMMYFSRFRTVPDMKKLRDTFPGLSRGGYVGGTRNVSGTVRKRENEQMYESLRGSRAFPTGSVGNPPEWQQNPAGS